jgi:Asp-tRNA(Asn)/Glu-tRNA(Gln) amidotransferase A subunit family amidase
VTTVDRTLDALPANFFPKQTSILGALVSPFKRVFRWLFGGASAPTVALPSATTDSAKLSSIQNIQAPTPSRPQPTYDELTTIAQKAYGTYDADAMHGLPVGIQLVGRRLEEEKVLEGMFVLRDALRRMGVPWEVPA